MENTELVKITITDIDEFKKVLLDRHQNNTNLCIRLESVFTQLNNSLKAGLGEMREVTNSRFTPTPLKKVMGQSVEFKESKKVELPKFDNDDKEAFKERVNKAYESFLDRDAQDLITSLEEIEIRGVAKIAKIANYKEASIDVPFIEKIKQAIKEKQEADKKKEEERVKFEQEEKDKQEQAIKEKQEADKKVNTKK
ncbi:hypothetical protein ETU08_00120 [Apibacter muscae]|uniref:hypothetical protein n=1 Tax=Apibacter muscae TaxID=2509004 RepID=UPI0011AC94F8|nr:hypothetical protein [Apibacter muscae]TWP31899.1 hypothetical protein ETU08_00120 [Apibacter muscae]